MSEISRRNFLKFMGAGSGVMAGRELVGAAPEPAGAPVLGPGKAALSLKVNGKTHDLNVEPRTTLLSALRHHLDFTGAKEVCDRGACGACTVWVDGKPIVSCLALAADCQGKEITTVEGIAGRDLDPLQSKFVEKEGLQCGFCIPGFIMSIKATLRDKPKATLDEVKKGCSGNVCRCAAYPGMFAAAMAVVKGEKPEEDLTKLSGADLKKVLEEKGIPKLEGADKVTGRAKYTYDVKLPGMLTARVLASPFARAQVDGEPDLDAARKVPGVKYVEIVNRNPGIGEAAAVAIAEDPQAADEALHVLRLKLKPGQAQGDPLQAFEEGEVREDRGSKEMRDTVDGADVKVERTYLVNMVQHAALEPHGCVASWKDQNLLVHESTQHVWGVAGNVARAAKLGQNQVRVLCEHMGGGFGAKIGPWSGTPRIIQIAKDLGVPVKCMNSRAGEMLAGGGRIPNVVQVKIGSTKDGKIVGEWRKAAPQKMGPYWYRYGSSCDQVRWSLGGVGPTPALRAPGAPPAQIVTEAILDDLAAAIDADPLEFRLKLRPDLKNWFEEGSKRIGWDKRQKKPGSAKGDVVRGIGVGCGEFAGSSGCDFIEVEVDKRTGVVKVLKIVVVFQGGFINKRGVLNQVKGGTIMGMSWALFEERVLDERYGAMLNPNLEFYKIAGPQDIPEIEVVLLGQAERSSGVGEAPVVPVAGALSNAIFNAIGKRVTKMPFSPRNVLEALGG